MYTTLPNGNDPYNTGTDLINTEGKRPRESEEDQYPPMNAEAIQEVFSSAIANIPAQRLDEVAFSNGSSSIGLFQQDNMPYELGELETPEGFIYKGIFENGMLTQGKLTYPNGDVYKGEFKKWEPNGEGTLTNTHRFVYKGEWKAGKKHGYGILTDPDGKELYNGSFRAGKLHGPGTSVKKNGNVYKGEYKNGLKDGYGIETYGESSAYIGEWKNGLKDGQGTQIKDGKDVYSGQ